MPHGMHHSRRAGMAAAMARERNKCVCVPVLLGGGVQGGRAGCGARSRQQSGRGALGTQAGAAVPRQDRGVAAVHAGGGAAAALTRSHVGPRRAAGELAASLKSLGTNLALS